ncbi:hypothetical protein F5B21DRAFT_461360 [Xylaria acuta]|nr:hypothetical protein F5B21DRAFT_461360 [Xylaria acuta]
MRLLFSPAVWDILSLSPGTESVSSSRRSELRTSPLKHRTGDAFEITWVLSNNKRKKEKKKVDPRSSITVPASYYMVLYPLTPTTILPNLMMSRT